MATIMDGNALSKKRRRMLAEEAGAFAEVHGRAPCLAVVLVGDDPASAVYVRNKKRACEEVGIGSLDMRLAASITGDELVGTVSALNARDDVDGILVQLPLPAHVNTARIIEAIDPSKDVDGFHPYNMGRLMAGEPTLVPCTPAGVMCMLREYGVKPEGKDVVVVGRSNIVGKPMALLLMMEHATVTICHSRTRGLAEKVSRADIVVAALGKPGFIPGGWIKHGAVVIDVGINRTDAGLTGDVQFAQASDRASLITPVPGGVGPMTVTMLLENTLHAARSRASKR